MKFSEGYNSDHNYDDIMVDEEGLGGYVAKVFGWTFLGIGLTAGIVLFFMWGINENIPGVVNFLYDTVHVLLGISIGLSVMAIALQLTILRIAPILAKLIYLLYAAGMGLLFTWFTIFYGIEAMGMAFALTAITFGGMCIIGLVTKNDLTSFGNILFAGLLGVILAIVVNWFVGSEALDYFISIICIVLFLGFAAYHSNEIKRIYRAGIAEGDEKFLANMAIYSALRLYITFINLLLSILRILGRNSD